LTSHADQHQAMRKALLESLREVARGGLAIPVFIQHIKDSFSYHFETDDMTYIAWRKSQNPLPSLRLPDATVLRDQPAPRNGSMTGTP
jgi:hemerythrin